MAANTVLFVGWDRPLAGREMHANELFSGFMAYLTKQQEAGNIESFEPIILGAHGGDLNGFALIRGARDKLDALRRSEDFLNLVTDATHNVGGFGVVDGWTGEGVATQMSRWQKYIPK